VPIVGRHWNEVQRRHPGISDEKALRALVRDMIGTMVADVLAETRRRLTDACVHSVQDVRAAGRQLAGFSAGLAAEERALKQFLYRTLYNADALVPVREEAQQVVANLFQAYRTDASLLPPGWCNGGSETDRVRAVGDFIAGMTDRFAVARHRELVGPVDLPDRF